MSITSQQLLQILPNAGPRAGVFVPVLNTAMQRYQIVGSKRVAPSSPRLAMSPASWSTSVRFGGRRLLNVVRRAGQTWAIR